MGAGSRRFKLIACEVFHRELCIAAAESPNLIDLEFLEIARHERPDELRALIQARIDAEEGIGRSEAILLGYGLCGNGLAGARARSLPLVLPRAHDCCTVLLGSRAEFERRFGDTPSASWSSAGYLERGPGSFRRSELGAGLGRSYEDFVREYGEDNARYLWETLHPEEREAELRYIETAETAHLGHAEAMRAKAAAEGKEFVLIPGSTRLLRALVAGDWDEADFLVVPPGRAVEPAYDHETVLRAIE